MSYKIKMTPSFDLDLAEIDFILYEYPQKAKRIIEKIDQSLLMLAEMPKMHPVYEDFPVFRKIVIEDYLVFYLIDEEKKTIEIHRLIYGKMDLKKQLR